MVDIPERPDAAAEIIIYGVESEQVEEENDALNDMRCDLGISKAVEEEQEELMPSCFCLNLLDCLFMNISSYCKDKTKPGTQL